MDLDRPAGEGRAGVVDRHASPDTRLARLEVRHHQLATGRLDPEDHAPGRYFRDPEATADADTADDWFRTGDAVKVWPDGNLEIVGRTREMYISGGFNR